MNGCTCNDNYELGSGKRCDICDPPMSKKPEIALATPKTDKRKNVQKALANNNKMVEIPGLFLELDGKVYIVDTSSGGEISTELYSKFVLDAVLAAMRKSLSLSFKKEKGKK
jgi:hypothetical protein